MKTLTLLTMLTLLSPTVLMADDGGSDAFRNTSVYKFSFEGTTSSSPCPSNSCIRVKIPDLNNREVLVDIGNSDNEMNNQRLYRFFRAIERKAKFDNSSLSMRLPSNVRGQTVISMRGEDRFEGFQIIKTDEDRYENETFNYFDIRQFETYGVDQTKKVCRERLESESPIVAFFGKLDTSSCDNLFEGIYDGSRSAKENLEETTGSQNDGEEAGNTSGSEGR